MIDPKWIFFHCIKQNRNEPYICRQINDIYKVKVPDIEANEYLIPLCGYIPYALHKYYLAKYIRQRINVKISDDCGYQCGELPVDLVA